jgi:hypothetical protein
MNTLQILSRAQQSHHWQKENNILLASLPFLRFVRGPQVQLPNSMAALECSNGSVDINAEINVNDAAPQAPPGCVDQIKLKQLELEITDWNLPVLEKKNRFIGPIPEADKSAPGQSSGSTMMMIKWTTTVLFTVGAISTTTFPIHSWAGLPHPLRHSG